MEKILDAKTILSEIMGIMYLDLERAVDIMNSIYISLPEFKEWVSYKDVNLLDCDLIQLVYEYVLETANNEFCLQTSMEFPEDIYVYGNYLDTNFDCTEKTLDLIDELIESNEMYLPDMSVLFRWFYEQIK